jgi:hypothetical protein
MLTKQNMYLIAKDIDPFCMYTEHDMSYFTLIVIFKGYIKQKLEIHTYNKLLTYEASLSKNEILTYWAEVIYNWRTSENDIIDEVDEVDEKIDNELENEVKN